MNEALSSKIKTEMETSSLDPELLHNCIEEFDRVIFQVPQEFELNHFSLQHSQDDFENDNSPRGYGKIH